MRKKKKRYCKECKKLVGKGKSLCWICRLIRNRRNHLKAQKLFLKNEKIRKTL